MTYNSAPVSWYYRNQALFQMSTAEAEYIYVSAAIHMASIVQKMMVQATLCLNNPATIKTDNQATYEFVTSPMEQKYENF